MTDRKEIEAKAAELTLAESPITPDTIREWCQQVTAFFNIIGDKNLKPEESYGWKVADYCDSLRDRVKVLEAFVRKLLVPSKWPDKVYCPTCLGFFPSKKFPAGMPCPDCVPQPTHAAKEGQHGKED